MAKTQKPLKELVPELLEYVKQYHIGQIEHNTNLLEVYNGGILKHIEKSLQTELSPNAYQRAKTRISSINVLTQLVNKISQVYMDAPLRTALNDIDNDLMSEYVNDLDLDNKLSLANNMLTLHRYVALEPYIESGSPKLRVLPADRFIVWSDNPVNPTDMTVFIKFMGTVQKPVQRTDSRGVLQQDASQKVRDVALYYLYSEDEFMIVDADGAEYPNPTDGINPYGQIPFIYISAAPFELVPTPNTDVYQMSILIPKLLTDLNYATKFQAHSLVYAIDVEVDNLEFNPDSFLEIKSVEGEGKTPTIGTIKPEVDIDKVLKLIESTLGMWLDSLGVKSNASGALSGATAASGISKLIDQSDVTEVRKGHKKLFLNAEKKLWELISTMHSYELPRLKESRDFSNEFYPSIQFGELAPFVDPKTNIERIKLKLESKLTSYKRAVSEANPNLTPEEIDELLAEIEQEKLSGYNAVAKFLQPETQDSLIGEEPDAE